MTAVTITHSEKVLFPADGISKGEVAAYYAAVADLMLPHLRGRPVTMERFPNGIDADGFLQKNVVRGFPAWLERAELPKKGGSLASGSPPGGTSRTTSAPPSARILPA